MYFPDLGADKIHVFRFNRQTAQPLTAMEKLNLHATPGSGPRHMAFHPNGKYAYCIEEMGGMVMCFTYNNGKLNLVQRINSNEKKADEYSSADIHISPDGLFLYTSNRGENTIRIFAIGADGKLTLLGHQSSLGNSPRNFTLDPSGHFLLVANQLTNNIVVFKRDLKTGLLKKTGTQIGVPAPSCLQMKVYR
ncbi:MAG: beta-propeller fold lactonase family protein [Bacteroidota bacterium]